MFEDHQLIRRAAVQAFCNLCISPIQVKRCEGKNDKVSYLIENTIRIENDRLNFLKSKPQLLQDQ